MTAGSTRSMQSIMALRDPHSAALAHLSIAALISPGALYYLIT